MFTTNPDPTRFTVEANEGLDSAFGLEGDAFYAEVPVTAVWMMHHTESLVMLDWAGYEDSIGCECEQDWNCPLHRDRAGTWVETRYDHLID